jgi:carbon-monoxide dehydrogenase medium subunit
MIPAPFRYERADSVAHAIDLLATHGENAKLLAGGHSLIPLMRLRLARPSVLIDISRIGELSYVRDEGAELAIGAATCHHDVHHSPVIREHCPVLAHAAGLVGDPQVRHMGTIGGSVAHGDPVSDEPAVLLALDARFVLAGSGGSRREARASGSPGSPGFFRGFFETDIRPGEVLVEIRVPKPAAGTGWSYRKFTRRAQDFALVGVACLAGPSNGGMKSAVAMAGMGLTPIRASAVEEALAGGASAESAARHAADGTTPPSDTFGSSEYRRHLAGVMTHRSLEEAMARRG